MGKSESGDGQEGYQDPETGSNNDYHYNMDVHQDNNGNPRVGFLDIKEEEHKIRVAQLAASLHPGCKKMERE